MDSYILIIEDNVELRALYADVLSREGVASVCATNGKEAIDYLTRAARPPRLILLDMIMPVMNGDAFLHEIADCSSLHDVPIIACSAVRPPSLPKQVQFLQKPIDTRHLLEKIHALLSSK